MNSKNRWPLALIILFGLFVGLLVIYILVARYNALDLVNADYYEQGMNYQQQLDRIHRGKQTRFNLLLEYNRQEQLLKIYFPEHMDPKSISGRIIFFRPSDAGLDIEIPVRIGHDHQQNIELDHYSRGLWRLKIFWQQDTLEFDHEEILIIE